MTTKQYVGILSRDNHLMFSMIQAWLRGLHIVVKNAGAG